MTNISCYNMGLQGVCPASYRRGDSGRLPRLDDEVRYVILPDGSEPGSQIGDGFRRVDSAGSLQTPAHMQDSAFLGIVGDIAAPFPRDIQRGWQLHPPAGR